METFIIIAVTLAVGFLIGWHLHASIFTKIMTDMMDVLGVSEADLLKSLERLKNKKEGNDSEHVCDIRIESDEMGLRAYRCKDELFLAQAKDVDELVTRIIQKVGKGVYVQCTIENGGDIFRKTAENYQKNLH